MMSPQWRRLLILASVTGVGFLLGLGGHFLWARATAPRVPGTLVAEFPVMPGGTEATIDRGAVTLSVPVGAVTEPQTVSVYKQPVSDRVRAVPSGGGEPVTFPSGALTTYFFAPTDFAFKKPITATFALPERTDGLVFVNNSGKVRVLPGTGTRNAVTVSMTGFDFSRPGAITVRESSR